LSLNQTEERVIWAKREFKSTDDYGPYKDRLANLHLNLRGPAGMMMVMVKNGVHIRDVYISLPDATYLPMFGGFKTIDEGDLPKEVDVLLYADQATDDFKKHFTVRSTG
jgi:hypothetical protein